MNNITFNIGDKLYIPTVLYIGHGEDDIQGGLAIISKIINNNSCSYEYNRTMVEFKGFKGDLYNLNYLLEHQIEWKERYGERNAYHDPDYNDYGERW